MEKFKRILMEYLSVILYACLAILIEMVGSAMTDGKFYIKDPRYLFTIVGILSAILVIMKRQRSRIVTASIFLVIQGIVNVLFIVLFDMAGQWFDYSMFSLRNDAMGILESLPINFWFFFFLLVGLSAFIVFGLRLTRRIKVSSYTKKQNMVKNLIASMSIILFIFLNVLTASSINGANVDKYDALLNSNDTSKYNQYGITSNFINEIYSGTAYKSTLSLSTSEIENFLYSDVSETPDYFGVSEGNNVVTILGETFEWFSFVPGSYEFPNGSILNFPNGMSLSEEEVRVLYPNLWRLYDNSFVLTNYHAREKTDISENYSILGSYPIGKYINYDYYDNVIPQSMPNMLKTVYGENYSSQYFHDGYSDFYNRSKSVTGLGFDSWYTTEKMLDLENSTYNDYGAIGERNCDSEMIETCKDLMFPTDRKFYTYITTISMHGMYSKRTNLDDKGYYDDLREYGIDIDNCTEDEYIFYSYLACAKETDKAVGMILDALNDKGLSDNTTLVFFGDHQGYYQGLSNYVKDITSASQATHDGYNYMDLYRVPCFIYDSKLVNAATNNGSNEAGRFSDKFSSSCDIVPTLLGLLGIKYYSNMYYGHSIFTDTESLVYSRGYGYFLDNYSYFYNLNSFTYVNDDYKTKYGNYENYMADLKLRGEVLVTKIKYVDSAYIGKIFNYSGAYNNYQNGIKVLNNLE